MCSCCNGTYYGDSERRFFDRATEHLGMTFLTGKQVMNPKKLPMIDNILLIGHYANFESFSILLKERNEFKSRLKESISIKHGKPKLNRNIYSYSLEFSD